MERFKMTSLAGRSSPRWRLRAKHRVLSPAGESAPLARTAMLREIGTSPAFRRALDIVGSLALLVLTAPALLAAMLATAAAARGRGTVFARRELRLRDRRVSVIELRTGPGEVGHFLWMTRVSQLPILLSILQGELSFEDPLSDLLRAADR